MIKIYNPLWDCNTYNQGLENFKGLMFCVTFTELVTIVFSVNFIVGPLFLIL